MTSNGYYYQGGGAGGAGFGVGGGDYGSYGSNGTGGDSGGGGYTPPMATTITMNPLLLSGSYLAAGYNYSGGNSYGGGGGGYQYAAGYGPGCLGLEDPNAVAFAEQFQTVGVFSDLFSMYGLPSYTSAYSVPPPQAVNFSASVQSNGQMDSGSAAKLNSVLAANGLSSFAAAIQAAIAQVAITGVPVSVDIPTSDNSIETVIVTGIVQSVGDSSPSLAIGLQAVKYVNGSPTSSFVASRTLKLSHQHPGAHYSNNLDGLAASKYNTLDIALISMNEGGQYINGYMTTSGGVTVATGFDLGQFDLSQLTGKVDPALLTLISPYLGLNGPTATNFLNANPLTITQAQADELDTFALNYEGSQASAVFNNAAKNADLIDLPSAVQTVLVDLTYNLGPGNVQNTQFFKDAATTNWNDPANSTLLTTEYHDLLNMTSISAQRSQYDAAEIKNIIPQTTPI